MINPINSSHFRYTPSSSGYPIIRVVAPGVIARKCTIRAKLLKFLIRRGAQLNVADSQGRRAVHIACTAWYHDLVRVLVEAGAELGVPDKFGRLPLHFAASAEWEDCLNYLLRKFPDMDIDVPDHDGWSPLMWAARSGDSDSVITLVDRGADLWPRGRGSNADDEWSALKLAWFAGSGDWVRSRLVPEERVRVNPDGEQEEWDDGAHLSLIGHAKSSKNGEIYCKSCLTHIRGIDWCCIDCTADYSLCFKCHGQRSFIHDPGHNFDAKGPLYRAAVREGSASSSSPSPSSRSAQSDGEISGGAGDDTAKGDASDHDTWSSRAATPDEGGVDLDTFDFDASGNGDGEDDEDEVDDYN